MFNIFKSNTVTKKENLHSNCKKCGYENQSHYKRCLQCGYNLSENDNSTIIADKQSFEVLENVTPIESSLMKKAIICLYGGPGVGKSTTAAYLFTLCKLRAMNVELVREYIKDWVWEGRTVIPGDQLYIFAKQSRKERILFKDTDLIITDSPIWLSPIYEKKFDIEPFVTEIAIEKQLSVAAKAGFRYMHFILNRQKPYQQEGRYQTEEEAKLIDIEVKNLLTRKQMPFWEINGDEEAAKNILKILDKELFNS